MTTLFLIGSVVSLMVLIVLVIKAEKSDADQSKKYAVGIFIALLVFGYCAYQLSDSFTWNHIDYRYLFV